MTRILNSLLKNPYKVVISFLFIAILSIFYSSNDKRMNIVLSVDEGPQYKYRNFSWEGMTLFDQETLERALALDKSKKYSEEDFNMAVFSRVQGLYLDRGYIYSRVEPKITPIGKDSLDIH